MKAHKKIYVLLAGLTALIVVLFLIVFMQLGVADTHIKNLESNFQIALKSGASTSTEPLILSSSSASSTNGATSSPVVEEGNGIVIPTGIVFTATSSPALQPQAPVTFIVQNVTEQPDGKVFVHLTASTNDAQSYSAISPSDFFQIVNLNGPNVEASAVDGSWSSMPPQETVQGTLMFQVEPGQSSIILQVGQLGNGTNITFYQFDFQAKTYKPIVLG